MFDSGALQARDHLRPQHRGDTRRDEQPDKDDRDPFYPPYRVRHTRNMRPIKKAAIRETIRIATSMTANIAARLPERQLSLRQSWPASSGVRTPTSGNPFGPLRERKAHQGSAPLTTKSASRAPHCAQRSRLAQTTTSRCGAVLLAQLCRVRLKPLQTSLAPHDQPDFGGEGLAEGQQRHQLALRSSIVITLSP